MQVDTCVRLTNAALKAGKCVIIGLQSTGEARTLEAVDELCAAGARFNGLPHLTVHTH